MLQMNFREAKSQHSSQELAPYRSDNDARPNAKVLLSNLLDPTFSFYNIFLPGESLFEISEKYFAPPHPLSLFSWPTPLFIQQHFLFPPTHCFFIIIITFSYITNSPSLLSLSSLSSLLSLSSSAWNCVSPLLASPPSLCSQGSELLAMWENTKKSGSHGEWGSWKIEKK